mmetsp:Transcript_23574/g.11356  ORF Transcript_23574/g.11356 Transcript_23574/m.11356 type:complete len:87 (+) Transcript_23574:83-343(+)
MDQEHAAALFQALQHKLTTLHGEEAKWFAFIEYARERLTLANTVHEDCVICLESLAKGSAVRVPCFHRFHSHCLSELWFGDHQSAY